MPELEPSKAELSAASAEIAQSYRLSRTQDCPNLAVDGLIPGVDAPGRVENGVFTPDAPNQAQPAYWRDAPWYLILTLEDLDRVILGKTAKISELRRIKALLDRDIKRQEDGLTRTVNYYSELLPECPEGQKSKTITGPITRGSYRIEPGRVPQFKLLDPDLATAHALTRLSEPRPVALSNTDLALASAAYGGYYALPGYECIEQPPVSYTPARDVAGPVAEPELAGPLY